MLVGVLMRVKWFAWTSGFLVALMLVNLWDQIFTTAAIFGTFGLISLLCAEAFEV
jgi:hypothetical protein